MSQVRSWHALLPRAQIDQQQTALIRCAMVFEQLCTVPHVGLGFVARDAAQVSAHRCFGYHQTLRIEAAVVEFAATTHRRRSLRQSGGDVLHLGEEVVAARQIVDSLQDETVRVSRRHDDDILAESGQVRLVVELVGEIVDCSKRKKTIAT